jgi:putative phosphoribosyl transferase
LITSREEADRTNVFDISLLAKRLVDVLEWLNGQGGSIAQLPIGLFGASTGAAAALVAAAFCREGSERWFHAVDAQTSLATSFR